MQALMVQLDTNDLILYKPIRETNGELMAIGIKPMDRAVVKPYVSSFPLLK